MKIRKFVLLAILLVLLIVLTVSIALNSNKTPGTTSSVPLLSSESLQESSILEISSEEIISQIISKEEIISSEEETLSSKQVTSKSVSSVAPPVSSKAPVVSKQESKPQSKAESKYYPPSQGKITLTQDEIKAIQQRIVDLVNEARVENGVGKLTRNNLLDNAALVRAKEQEVQFSHTRPNGTSFSTAVTQAGYQYTTCGENLFYSSAKTDDFALYAFNAWKGSSGHWQNIISPNYAEIGVGVYTNGNNIYAVQLFGKR